MEKGKGTDHTSLTKYIAMKATGKTIPFLEKENSSETDNYSLKESSKMV
jgi:hypothetical protein